MTGATADLAGFASRLTFGELPPAVVELVALHLLDTIGAGLTGAARPWNAIVRRYAEQETAPGPCVLYGTGRTARPEWAALANGTAGHGFEIDDYAVPALAHPGCVVTATALAVGEELDARGHDVLAAAAAGFETVVRFGLATTPSLTSDRGFHVTGVHGVFGAAAVACRLRRLDPAVTTSAYGLAASHASGVTEYTRSGGEVKRLHAGLAAMGGIRAAGLAAAGFTGPPTAVEGPRGLLRAFVAHPRPDELTAALPAALPGRAEPAGEQPRAAATKPVPRPSDGAAGTPTAEPGRGPGDGLGERWRLSGLAVKRHCVCAGIQAPLEAMAGLRRQGLRAEDVTEIVVGLDAASRHHVGAVGPCPRDMTEAQFGARHAVAMSLVLGGNDPSHYARLEAAGFALPEVSDLAARVRLAVDPEADACWPGRLLANVTVHLRDGTVLTRRAEAPGTPTNPMRPHEIEAKFAALAGETIGGPAARAVRDALWALTDDAPVRAVLAPARAAFAESEAGAGAGAGAPPGTRPEGRHA